MLTYCRKLCRNYGFFKLSLWGSRKAIVLYFCISKMIQFWQVTLDDSIVKWTSDDLKHKCFIHPIFRFWFLVTFGNEVMKIQKDYIIVVYILQGKMGKTEKTGKKITQLKWPKYQKPKDENMGWTKHKLQSSSE